MRLVTRKVALLAALLLASALPAAAQVESGPVPGFHGHVEGTLEGSLKGQGSSATNAVVIVYDNTASAVNFGITSTDLAADWGDRLLLTGTGLVSSHVFTVANGSAAGLNLLTAQVAVDFFDTASSTYLGGYTTNINFGSGLPPGFFSLVTVSGLDPLVINIPNPDIIVIQTVLSKTGSANRLGIASLDPPTVGSSPISMYIAASTIGGGVPGFYNVGNPPIPANPGYQLGLAEPPVGVTAKSWGSLKKLYR